jgi:hypothetical protein
MLPKYQSLNIVWDFTVSQQLFSARYGHAGPVFYRQHLPGGMEFFGRYPPKPIDERTYRLAQRANELKTFTSR